MRRTFIRLSQAFGLLLILLVVIALPFYRSSKTVDELRENYAKAPSQWVQVNDMNVHYRIEGTGEPLVLLHGTGSHLHTWNHWTGLLKNDFQIIRMDLPGFGLTGPQPEDDYSIGQYSDFLTNFLSALKIDRCHLAGNSLGGEIAWNFALDQPDKVNRLILIDPAGFENPAEVTLAFRVARIPVLKELMKTITPRSLMKSSLKEVYYDKDLATDSMVTVYLDHLLRVGNRDAMVKRMNMSRVDRSADLTNLSQPTLVIWGKEDVWIPVEHASYFHDRIANCELTIMEETGHVPMEEKPVESSERARKFLLPVDADQEATSLKDAVN